MRDAERFSRAFALTRIRNSSTTEAADAPLSAARAMANYRLAADSKAVN